jgi:hypothetical protein
MPQTLSREMTRYNLAQRTILTALFVLFVGLVSAAELNDSTFGFRLNVPEGFTKLEVDESEPDTIYKFVDREPTQDDPAHVIQIQRLRGVISLSSRMKQSEIPIIKGIKTTLQEFTWKGHELDVLRQTIVLPNGIEYVIFGIQYPLSDEAVQLQVGGPVREEERTYELFSQLAGAFHNTKPIHSPSSLTFRKLSPAERVQKLIAGIVQLAFTAVVIVVLFRIVKRAFSKKKGTDN